MPITSRVPIPSLTATGSTVARLAIKSRAPLQVALLYANATSDKAGSTLKSYNSTAQGYVTASSASGQTTLHAVGTGLTNANVIAIYSVSLKVWEFHTVSSVTATTIVTGENLSNNINVGDLVIVRGALVCSLPVGAATKDLLPLSAIPLNDAGQSGWLELDGTSACTINTFSGQYQDNS